MCFSGELHQLQMSICNSIQLSIGNCNCMYTVLVRQTWPEWLVDLMEIKDVNQKGLASLANVSASTVSHWLTGTKPEGHQIIRLANLAEERAVDLFALIYNLPDAAPDRLT